MKKFILLIFSLFLLQNISYAKDTLQFDFPNEGWHETTTTQRVKKFYVPHNQTSENFTESISITEKAVNIQGISPFIILHKQLGKDRNNYNDIAVQYIKQDIDDAMYTWCSQRYSTCVIKRAFKGNEGIIIVTYTNKMPHYSQNLFTNWVNIIGSAKSYNPEESKTKPANLIEL